MGKVSSATVAAHLGRSFPSLRLAVMVGICGSTPVGYDDQVLLGDVVISDKIPPDMCVRVLGIGGPE
ncbi:hypothetical protein QBC38DRAFT_494386 [Podospora fimiseda]|uniref:Nucleoside phosphorylase domain-containing protein n=1 Tax=Podospora fimiseda TaxID=252190 RepID=A0AAN6YJW4_9PEZI|nr:hypothetical protein QBC38DRAFT_494386 [Podospora fimiseda]